MPQVVPVTDAKDPEECETTPRDCNYFLGQQVHLELDARLSSLSLERSLTIEKQDVGENRYKYKVTGQGGTHFFEATETIEGVSARFINSRLVVLNERSEKICELLSHPGLGSGAIRLVRKSTMLGEVVQRQDSLSGERYSFPVIYIYASGTYPLFMLTKCGSNRKCKCCLTSCHPIATEFQVEKVMSKRIIAGIHREMFPTKENGQVRQGEETKLESGTKTEEQYTVTMYVELSGIEKLLLVTSVIMLDFQLQKKSIKKAGKCMIYFAMLAMIVILAVIVYFAYKFLSKSSKKH